MPILSQKTYLNVLCSSPMFFRTSLLNHCNGHLIHHLNAILSIPVTGDGEVQTGVKHLLGTYLTPHTVLGVGSLTWKSLTSSKCVSSLRVGALANLTLYCQPLANHWPIILD